MFISTSQIADWRDLENRVAQIFQEMGYEVENQKIVNLAGRGKKAVDVWVRDPLASINQIYLIECKNWSNEVHQETVHAFMAVMEGAGANTGFIVSKAGFQSGAYEAIKNTNIHLMTFEELQHSYGQEWLRIHKQHLDEQVKKLQSNLNLYLFDEKVTASNNMFFHNDTLRSEVGRFLKWGVNLLTIGTIYVPKSYLAPEPISCASHYYDLNLVGTDYMKGEDYIFGTVREFFKDVTKIIADWNKEFEKLLSDAHLSFDVLSEELQSDLMRFSLIEFTEEMPLRVLKRYLHPEKYKEILDLISKDKG